MDWTTADTHFGHSNIIGYESRPFGNVLEVELHNYAPVTLGSAFEMVRERLGAGPLEQGGGE